MTQDRFIILLRKMGIVRLLQGVRVNKLQLWARSMQNSFIVDMFHILNVSAARLHNLLGPLNPLSEHFLY